MDPSRRGDAVQRVEERGAERRALHQTAEHQADERQSGEKLEVGAENLFEAAGLPGDVEGTKPFDVGAGRPGPED